MWGFFSLETKNVYGGGTGEVYTILHGVEMVDRKKRCFFSSLKILTLRGTPCSSWATNSGQTKNTLLHTTKN